jgi:hypothetical protein
MSSSKPRLHLSISGAILELLRFFIRHLALTSSISDVAFQITINRFLLRFLNSDVYSQGFRIQTRETEFGNSRCLKSFVKKTPPELVHVGLYLCTKLSNLNGLEL